MADITETRDETKGKLRQVGGDIKKGVGDVANDPELKREGEFEHKRGQTEENVAKGERKLREMGNE